MNIIDIIFISIGLAMDAFAVSICKGIFIQKRRFYLLLPLSFCLFQMIMPLLGFYFGSIISDTVSLLDHWISFIILLWIGLNMIFSSNYNDSNQSFSFMTIFLLSIATSIDAFCVGVLFSFYSMSFIFSILCIGLITFILCFFGCILGHFFESSMTKKSNIFGGLILIIIGFKILFEHLGFI